MAQWWRRRGFFSSGFPGLSASTAFVWIPLMRLRASSESVHAPALWPHDFCAFQVVSLPDLGFESALWVFSSLSALIIFWSVRRPHPGSSPGFRRVFLMPSERVVVPHAWPCLARRCLRLSAADLLLPGRSSDLRVLMAPGLFVFVIGQVGPHFGPAVGVIASLAGSHFRSTLGLRDGR